MRLTVEVVQGIFMISAFAYMFFTIVQLPIVKMSIQKKVSELQGNLQCWQRPDGPPTVWQLMDIYPNSRDLVRISIQEIPEDRIEEALDYLVKYYFDEEPLFKVLGYKRDPIVVQDIRSMWKFQIKQGVSIGAYKLDDKGDIMKLVGTDILFVSVKYMTLDLLKVMENFNSTRLARHLARLNELENKVNAHQVFKIDKYIHGSGLSVHPSYRGHGIDYNMLKTRTEVGRKYKVRLSANFFRPAIIGLAEDVGYRAVYIHNFADFLAKEGFSYVNPPIEERFMAKKLY